jgi:hypothetical protein
VKKVAPLVSLPSPVIDINPVRESNPFRNEWKRLEEKFSKNFKSSRQKPSDLFMSTGLCPKLSIFLHFSSFDTFTFSFVQRANDCFQTFSFKLQSLPTPLDISLNCSTVRYGSRLISTANDFSSAHNFNWRVPRAHNSV